MEQWHFAVGGQQSGPFDRDAAVAFARSHPDAYCWRPGFGNWLPVTQVAELQGGAGGGSVPPSAPPPGAAGGRFGRADEIDYKILGAEMQFVEVELDPGESAVAEAGAMMYKDATVVLDTIFGDGSGRTGPSFLDKLVGAGKRVLTGESLFMTVFTNSQPSGKAHVAFAAPYPGNILPIRLGDHGGRLICQKDAFLAAAKGVSIGIQFQRKILTGLFGGEGFIMEKLEGDGLVFVHMGGTLVERTLAPGEKLHVDTGCLAALTDTVQFDVIQAGGIKTMLFGGEGVFFVDLTGPGKVWIQSLPFSRLAGRMLAAAPQLGGSKEEGSVLGPLGRVLRGDQ